jgi:hypothetical protein
VELLLNNNVSVFAPPQGEADECWFVFNIQVSEDMVASLIPVNRWLNSTQCNDETFEPDRVSLESFTPTLLKSAAIAINKKTAKFAK